MTASGLVQTALWLAALLACGQPLGIYMARVYSNSPPSFMQRWLGPIERWLLRMAGQTTPVETTWRQYAHAVLWFSVVSFLGVYLFQRLQGWLPLNPAALSNVAPDLAFNTAMSFVTNTNWQNYGGESTMSYSTQMLALTVQNFTSAAAGMAVLAALMRGLTRQSVATIGNFWVDLVRGTLYVLLPLSIVFALLLVSQGVVQTFQSYQQVELLEPTTDAEGRPVTTQTIAVGPAASQVAIKQLGTNGGGFFNANSAHPFENPTPLSNFLQLLAILLIPAALCHTFGEMVGDRRQGRALLSAMLLLFVPPLLCVMVAEQAGNPTLAGVAVDGMTADGVPLDGVAVDQSPSDKQPGGNMEGKELRFGIAPSAHWSAATTAASNGSVNSMHDSYGPIGGLVTMWFMQLGEVVFGGVGSGLYGMLVFALVAVFISGLMVGRTPEYLGKKIGAFEMKMAALAILLPCALALLGTAATVATEAGKATIFNPGPHGFSEALYAYSSASNNNGSAFAGLNGNTPLHNGLLAIAMFGGRFGVMLPVLAIAGSLAAKKSTPAGAGTLPTHTPLFVVLLAAVVIIVGALSFFPALALGPIVEQLQMTRG